jgi:hypothetical protein
VRGGCVTVANHFPLVEGFMRGPLALLSVFAAVALATAAPPVVTLPPEIRGDVSAFVVVKPSEVKDADAVKFVPLDAGLSVFPGDLLTDKKVTVVVAAKAGRYRLLAYSGNKDGASEPAITTLVIGGATTPPPVPPVDPPAPIISKLHFMVVRPSGPIAPSTEAAMNLPAWSEVKAAGHTYSDLPFDALPESAKLKFTGQPLPFLLVWEHKGGQIVLTERPAGKMPTTDTDLRGLLR